MPGGGRRIDVTGAVETHVDVRVAAIEPRLVRALNRQVSEVLAHILEKAWRDVQILAGRGLGPPDGRVRAVFRRVPGDFIVPFTDAVFLLILFNPFRLVNSVFNLAAPRLDVRGHAN